MAKPKDPKLAALVATALPQDWLPMRYAPWVKDGLREDQADPALVDRAKHVSGFRASHERPQYVVKEGRIMVHPDDVVVAEQAGWVFAR